MRNCCLRRKMKRNEEERKEKKKEGERVDDVFDENFNFIEVEKGIFD